MTRVFVSSVSAGLETARQQIIAELQTAGYDVGAMERFGSQPQPPIDVCLREVRNAGIVVLIIGPRYGSLLPQGVSYTHAEYREARAAGLPVLAFRIPDDPHLNEDEREQLKAFATEVGSTTTWAELSATDSLDLLPGRVLAALTAAANRGELGHRFSLFQRYERFFAGQLGGSAALLNHDGPFVGREQQLDEVLRFIDGHEPLLLLKAPGGSGKSRLLLEAAKKRSSATASQFLFVDSGAGWSAEDINALPITPVVLVFDDAHRRPDLDRVISASRQRNEHIRCVVSCRPSAVSIVQPLIAQLVTSTGPIEMDLPVLGKTEAEALARECLGPYLADFAERLVAIADRNPLVIRVGARCMVEKLVVPEALGQTPEAFRTAVLDRLLDDPSMAASDAPNRRRLLEMISAIGPVATESDESVGQLANLTDLAEHDVRRLVATLEWHQFLMRRGRVVRVSPDVLADHLLYKAAVDEMGRPTGFVDLMVKSFPSSLENILANAAELDWRSASATPGNEPVLTAIWRDVLTNLGSASNRQRAEIVGQLKRAAVFAPAAVLEICEWLIANPEAPADEQLAKWGLEDFPDKLTEALTEVVALIGSQPDFTRRCAAELWILGERDERQRNLFSSHPRRRLADFLKYTRGSGWESSDGAHVKAIGFLVDRLGDQASRASATWAISALGEALGRIGEANKWNRRVFTISEFSLASYLPALAERRNAVIHCLRNLALGTKVDESAAALDELGELLQPPRGPLGRGLGDDEITAWRPEAETACAVLQTIATTADSELVRYLARRQLRSVHQDHWPQIAPLVQQAVLATPPVPSEQLYDLLVGMPWQEQLDDWRSEDSRVATLCDQAAVSFWSEHGTPRAVVSALLAAVEVLKTIDRRTDSHVGRLTAALVHATPGSRRDFIEELMITEAGQRLLRTALVATYEKEPLLAERLVSELSLSEHEQIRVAALESVQWMIERTEDITELLQVTTRLSQDHASSVRGAAAEVLRRFPKRFQAEAIRILCDIDWNGALWLAETALGALDVSHGLDPALLSDEQIDRLLAGIERLQTLDGRNYEVLQFLSFASSRRPQQTIDTLIGRVKATDERRRDKAGERGVPLPYNGRGLDLPGVHGAASHPDLVRLVRNASIEATGLEDLWFRVLFQATDPDLSVGRDVLREWIVSGDSQKIVAGASLLRGFDHSLVFAEHELIRDFLIAANAAGAECLKDTKSELFSLAMSGVYSGAPGEPAPRHLEDKAQAQRMIEAYRDVEPIRQFYESLLAHAEGNIRIDVALWDEED